MSGTRYEHYRVLLDDKAAWFKFHGLCQELARGNIPVDVLPALRLGRMTALKKGANRVRGIVAGAVLRRLTCKAVAQQFAKELLDATEPWQYALYTRAGTDALAHAVRLLLETDHDRVLVSLDGVGAFDHIKRAVHAAFARGAILASAALSGLGVLWVRITLFVAER